MKVRLETSTMGAYPDIMVVCGDGQFYGRRRDLITKPALIGNILADWTEAAIERCRACRHIC